MRNHNITILGIILLASYPRLMAEDGIAVVYRCPRNLYTSTITAKEAGQLGCRTLDGAPVVASPDTDNSARQSKKDDSSSYRQKDVINNSPPAAIREKPSYNHSNKSLIETRGTADLMAYSTFSVKKEESGIKIPELIDLSSDEWNDILVEPSVKKSGWTYCARPLKPSFGLLGETRREYRFECRPLS